MYRLVGLRGAPRKAQKAPKVLKTIPKHIEIPIGLCIGWWGSGGRLGRPRRAQGPRSKENAMNRPMD